MRLRDMLPAFALLLLATGAVAAHRLLPEGEATLAVRLDRAPDGLDGALALPGVALLDLPAPGLAVLRGDAAAIRARFGLSISWQGRPPCSPAP